MAANVFSLTGAELNRTTGAQRQRRHDLLLVQVDPPQQANSLGGHGADLMAIKVGGTF